MKSEKLLNAIGKIDDDLILNAVNDTKKKKNIWLTWGSIAAMLVLCIGIFGFVNRSSRTAVSSVVMLDVNPSISLTVNEDEKIISADALNEDGNIVLSGMNLVGVDMDVAIYAIMGSLLQKGYLSDLQNAILVSVENNDAEKSTQLQTRISAMISSALQNGNLDGAVLSQTLSSTTDLEQMAQEYQISLGKAALIQEVAAQDSTLTVAKLVPLSITEIALISQSKNLSSGAVTQNGIVSDKAYIGREAALEIAYDYADVNVSDVTNIAVEFDSDDEGIVYEIDFYVGAVKYEYDIDARTGRVLKYEVEHQSGNFTGNQLGNSDGHSGSHGNQPGTSGNQSGTSGNQSAGQYIGEEAAKEAALANAKIAAGEVRYLNVWIDYDDGIAEHYEVEFAVGNVEYEYEIDLYTGAVLSSEIEDHSSDNMNHSGSSGDANGNHHADSHESDRQTSDSAAMIGAEAAKSAALSHAGLTASQVYELEVEYDDDHGVAVYEVEFKYNGYEYEYEIDAATGAVLEYEIDD